MKVSFACFLFIVICGKGIAQIDSLKKALLSQKDDSLKVETLLAISKEYLGKDPFQSILFANNAKSLSQKIKYLHGEAYSYKGIGLVNVMQGKYVESIENYEKALAIFDSLGDKRGQANILSNQGTVYFNQADDAKALELFLKGLAVAEQTTDSARIATLLLNIGAVYAHKEQTHDEALEYYQRALAISRSLGDNNISGTINSNIGEIYSLRGEEDLALKYFRASLNDYSGSENTPYALNNIGKVLRDKNDFSAALSYHRQALDFSKKIDAAIDISQSLLGLGETFLKKHDNASAIKYFDSAATAAQKISDANDELKSAYLGLALAHARMKDYPAAYRYQVMFSNIKDSLYNVETDRKVYGLTMKYEIQKKETEIGLLTKDKALQEVNLKKQRLTRNALIGGLSLAMIIALIIYRNYRNKIKTNKLLDSQKVEIENLVLNILPAEVAEELRKTGGATPKYYEKASVLFTDIKSFSKYADQLSPQEVVTELNDCFVAFDDIIEKYGLEKIKTIGDSYMCAGGIPTPDEGHIENIINAGLEIQAFVKNRNALRVSKGLEPWDIRIGIHTGPLVAGVVGKKKFAYDIWGGTVNIASRMESHGEAGKVNISAATYQFIQNDFVCIPRGKISAKNIGDVDMYFVEGRKVDTAVPRPLSPA